MSQLDLMKIFDSFDGEVNMSDFTPEELEDMLDMSDKTDIDAIKRKYFSFYDDVKSSSLPKQDW